MIFLGIMEILNRYLIYIGIVILYFYITVGAGIDLAKIHKIEFTSDMETIDVELKCETIAEGYMIVTNNNDIEITIKKDDLGFYMYNEGEQYKTTLSYYVLKDADGNCLKKSDYCKINILGFDYDLQKRNKTQKEFDDTVSKYTKDKIKDITISRITGMPVTVTLGLIVLYGIISKAYSITLRRDECSNERLEKSENERQV